MADHLTTEQLIERGKDAYARKAYAEALDSLDEVARRSPRFADIQNLRGLCFSMLGRYDEALEAFTTAAETNPGYVEAHLNRAITLTELNRYDEAGVSYQQASVADDEKTGGRMSSALAARLANAHQDVGDMYADGNLPADALEQYRRAVSLRPQFLDIRNKAVRTLIELRKVDEAIIEAQQILGINPAFVAARSNLGLAYYRRGDLESAKREWSMCLEQQPNNAQVRGYLGMIERGGAAVAES